MAEYTVVWRINLDADSAEEAAKTALSWLVEREILWDFEVFPTGVLRERQLTAVLQPCKLCSVSTQALDEDELD